MLLKSSKHRKIILSPKSPKSPKYEEKYGEPQRSLNLNKINRKYCLKNNKVLTNNNEDVELVYRTRDI